MYVVVVYLLIYILIYLLPRKSNIHAQSLPVNAYVTANNIVWQDLSKPKLGVESLEKVLIWLSVRE